MRRSGIRTLATFVVVTVVSLIVVVSAGWKPLLGLDLQGGVSVVLKPKAATTTEDQLNKAISIIRDRIDSLGVSEPEISLQGTNIVVQLPGVKDQQRALDLVGQTAELRFRPVLAQTLAPGLAAEKAATDASSTTTAGEGSPTTETSTPVTSVGVPTTEASATTAAPATTAGSSTSAKALGATGAGFAKGEVAFPATTAPAKSRELSAASTSTAPPAPPTSPATAVVVDPTATTEPGETSVDTSVIDGAGQSGLDLTPPEKDLADQTVILGEYDPKTKKETIRYLLGPTLGTGRGVQEATQRLNQNAQWEVSLNFKDGPEGVDAWRGAARECFGQTDLCPTGLLAIVLDGKVISAPRVRTDFKNETGGVISGNFDQRAATDLATALRYGALPVELERQQSQEVSATVGKDALRAGVVAGLLGLALVAVYILAYYRILGLVALSSLGLSFGLLWSIISYLGANKGLALSLSGVVGIIVSIGISIDSNIVYFETIKDDMHGGRDLYSSAQRAFKGAMSTIIKADAVSLIAAVLLYVLTVGPVRGFAFYLGLATVLDLIASYFFMRPAVNLLTRTDLARTNTAMFGIPTRETLQVTL